MTTPSSDHRIGSATYIRDNFLSYYCSEVRLESQSGAERLSAVICDDADGLPAGIELHVFGGFCAFVIGVVEDDAAQPPHHIMERKLQIWKGLETAQEVASKCFFTGDCARWIF